MSTNTCTDVYGDPAISLVDDGWYRFKQYAQQSYELASVQINGINDFSIPFHQWNVKFDPSGELSGFIRPDRPELQAIVMPDLSGGIADAPTVAVGPIQIDEAPVEPDALSQLPSFNLPATPGELDAARPGAAPAMNLRAAPVAPVLDEVDEPELELVELPAVPDVDVQPFAEAAPVFDAQAPNELLEFTEQLYSSPLLDQSRQQISAMMSGNFYLPATVEAALFERAVDRAERVNLKQFQEARDLLASRGFEEPQGSLAARVAEIQYENRVSLAGVSRDVYTQAEQVALENLRFAVSQGLALEASLLQAHLTVEGRKFELAVKAKDIALGVFNARVTQFNSAVQAYNARVDAYRAYLDGLRAEVDVYRSQVEAAKVRGEINEQRVRAFAEMIRARLARAEMYRAEVEGFRVEIEAEKAKIEGHRSEVEAYKAFVQAYGIEWDAYGKRLSAETEKGRLFETLSRVYGSRVEVWKTKGTLRIEEQRANLAAAEAQLRQHDNQVRAVLGRLEAARAIVVAQQADNASRAAMYEADARIAGAAAEVDTRMFQAQTERNRTAVELALRDAELQIRQLLDTKALLLEAMKSGAQASSQLAASAFSAVNFGANVSSSIGKSRSCSTSFSYAGDISDA